MMKLPFVYFRRAHLVILSYLDSHQEGRRADLEVCVRGNVPFVCYLDINEMLVFYLYNSRASFSPARAVCLAYLFRLSLSNTDPTNQLVRRGEPGKE